MTSLYHEEKKVKSGKKEKILTFKQRAVSSTTVRKRMTKVQVLISTNLPLSPHRRLLLHLPGSISTSSNEQNVELPSAPPSASSRQMFRAAASDAAHTSHKIQPLLHPVFDLAFFVERRQAFSLLLT